MQRDERRAAHRLEIRACDIAPGDESEAVIAVLDPIMLQREPRPRVHQLLDPHRTDIPKEDRAQQSDQRIGIRIPQPARRKQQADHKEDPLARPVLLYIDPVSHVQRYDDGEGQG